ncbi:MAG: hypothetical protein HY053_00620 [Proteobacteria bacterium]|nr:hypothetical protein [Pseudomonadota bacterium]
MADLNAKEADFSGGKSVFVWSPNQAAEFKRTQNPIHRFKDAEGQLRGFTEIPDNRARLEEILKGDPNARILGAYTPGKSEILETPSQMKTMQLRK